MDKNIIVSEYIDRVETAISNASQLQTKLEQTQYNIHGASTNENRILINEMLRAGDKYLETGVWKGSWFVSALYKNDVTGIAIDNFSQFGGLEENRNEFLHNCAASGITEKMQLIENDCFGLTDEQKELVRDANVYFYDADHKFEDQEMALTYYAELLADTFIFIVDDHNWDFVAAGTKSGIEKANLKIHKEWILSEEKWYNGLYVAVLSR